MPLVCPSNLRQYLCRQPLDQPVFNRHLAMSFGSTSSPPQDCYQLVLPALIAQLVRALPLARLRCRWFVSLRPQFTLRSAPPPSRLRLLCPNLPSPGSVSFGICLLDCRHTECKVHTYHILYTHLAFASLVSRHLIGKTKLDSLIGSIHVPASSSSVIFIAQPHLLGVDRRDALLDFHQNVRFSSMSSTVPAA